jgi:hypothetical protein
MFSVRKYEMTYGNASELCIMYTETMEQGIKYG